MATSSFLTHHPNLRHAPSHIDLHDHLRSPTISISFSPSFPSHESHFPAVKTMKPRGVFLLRRAVECSSTNLGQESSLVDDDEEEDGLCPVDCVKEFKTEEEFSRIPERAEGTNSLVVVDFYRSSCGSCKYIEQGFAKLCKGSGNGMDSVVFLKHNVSFLTISNAKKYSRMILEDMHDGRNLAVKYYIGCI
ncbi:hypothetical protein KSP40_PGU005331 [Platanthera guangdongensis]|uniref:Thioredoxin domain-containing protein n=1 Tax=Platanthera guangdongensis TaxID=2320717 RepID=A0ABR2MYF3_9ASPA